MKAGSLNNRITVEKPMIQKDEYLSEVRTEWQFVTKLWANIRFISGKEATTKGVDLSTATASIRVRMNSLSKAIDNTYRIIYQDVIYNIEAVLPDLNGREYIDFACGVGANQGE